MKPNVRRTPRRFGPRITQGTAWLLAICAVGVATLPVSAQDRVDGDLSVTLLGTVVDAQTGSPLHGAFVSLGGDDGFLTLDDGSFALPAWPYGAYTVTVELLGYATTEMQVPGPEPEPFVVRMDPDPILLEGLTVLVDRLETRRRRVSVAVRAFDRDQLLLAPPIDVVDWVSGQYGLVTSYCDNSARPAATLVNLRSGALLDEGQECVMRRGRMVRPRVFIDEARAFGGLDELRSYRPQDLYAVEVYDRGTVIYAYTPHFVERVLKGRRFLNPVLLIP